MKAKNEARTDKSPHSKARGGTQKQPTARLKYRGDWRPRDDYDVGDLVTHSGWVWHCQIATNGDLAPSTDGIASNAWTLFCSRGRQGKTGAS